MDQTVFFFLSAKTHNKYSSHVTILRYETLLNLVEKKYFSILK